MCRSSNTIFITEIRNGHAPVITYGIFAIALAHVFKRGQLPLRPIQVSPIGLNVTLEWGDWRVLTNEFKWIALPSLVLLLLSVIVRVLLKGRSRELI